MKKHLILLVGILVWNGFPGFADGQESADYLGTKLEYVLTNVDNAYLEANKVQFAESHKKAFRDLGEHLIKKYPNISYEVTVWLESRYAESLRKLDGEDTEKHPITAEVFIVLDREHEEFRGQFLSFIRTKYPGFFGEVACYLRDNHLRLLREVLRMTLRMTSNVEPCTTIVMHPIPGEESDAVRDATQVRE